MIWNAFFGSLGTEESREAFDNSETFFENSSLKENNSKLTEEQIYVYLPPAYDCTVLKPYLEIEEWDEKNHVAIGRVKADSFEEFTVLKEGVRVRKVLPPLVREIESLSEEAFPSGVFFNSLNVSGAGVKVGIISDGVSLLPEVQASKSLPPDVRVLEAGAGEEGTAMLEIVHEIAPEAELYFHKAGKNHLEFNKAIDALVSVGCKIICDDIGWPDEPFFEDGLVATHVQETIENNDILYISAAGNDANRHYQGLFFDDGSGWHDFSAGMSTFKNLYVNISLGGAVTIILQWNDSWNSSENDYDLFLKDPAGNILACSENVQEGNASPLEYLIYKNPELDSTSTPTSTPTFTPAPISSSVWGIVCIKKDSGDPKILELFLYPDSSSEVNPTNIVAEDSIYGHPAIPEVLSVGAIDSKNPGLEIKPFSSKGPVSIYFPEYELRNKPDLSGPDNLVVTGKAGKNLILSGTSASAPYVAGIAALVWSAWPEKTAFEIREMLYTTTRDLGEPGYDITYGHGALDVRKCFQNRTEEAEKLDFIDSKREEAEIKASKNKKGLDLREAFLLFEAWVKERKAELNIFKKEAGKNPNEDLSELSA